MLELEIKGVDELLKNLKKVEDKFRRKFVLKAMRKGAKLVVKDAKSRVPNKTGRLKRSIGAVTVPKRKAFNIIIDIGPRVVARSNTKNPIGETDNAVSLANDGFYGSWIEFGNSRIKTKRPFMRPAFDANAAKALDVIAEELARELQKVL